MPKLKYMVSHPKIFKQPKCFVGQSKMVKDKIIECTEKEAIELLKLKLGRTTPLFERVGGDGSKKSEDDKPEIKNEEVI